MNEAVQSVAGDIRASGVRSRAPESSRIALICRALREGEYGAARLAFLRLDEHARAMLLESLEREHALSLLARLSGYMAYRLLQRLPQDRAGELLASLPAGKRIGVATITDHHRMLEEAGVGG